MTEIEWRRQRIAAARELLAELEARPIPPECAESARIGNESIRRRMRQHEQRLAELLAEQDASRKQKRAARSAS